jgi:hypothetical protein
LSNGSGWIPKVVGDAMFIHLKMTTRSTFSAEKDEKHGPDNISLIFFIKNE